MNAPVTSPTDRSARSASSAAVTAEAYAQWRATTLGGVTERVETALIMALTGPLERKRLLDVGTGDGTYAIEAASAGAHVIALDCNREMLAAARARANRRGVRLALRHGNATSLPFADASFEVVMAVTVLCLISSPGRAVAEMARVLAPGGRLIIGELARCSTWAAERRTRGWLGSDLWREAHFWSRSGLVRLLRAAGLEMDEVRGSVFYPPSGLAARAMEPLEPLLSRLNPPGAAFLAAAARKPGKSR